MNKYFSHKKVCLSGHIHDSQKEAGRCQELHLLLKAGEIDRLIIQPEFILQGKFKWKRQMYREIKYIADFQYFDKKTGKIIVEDTKGYRTKEYMIKKKMFLFQYAYKMNLEFLES